MKTKKLVRVPVLRRTPESAAAAMKRCAKRLDAVTYDVAVANARAAGVERELRYAAAAPLRRLIEGDRKAMDALRQMHKIAKDQLIVRPVSRGIMTQTGGLFPISSFGLTPGVHVFSPPYDLDRPGPSNGSTSTASADRDTGDMSVSLPHDNSSGFRAASASVVVIFQSTANGTISVSPRVQYDYYWLVNGMYLSAHCEGHLTITASRADNGQVLASRDIMLWSRTTESSTHAEASDGFVYPPDFRITFSAPAGKEIQVAITATVSGDQSGSKGVLGVFPSWSHFSSDLSAKVPWLVAELRT